MVSVELKRAIRRMSAALLICFASASCGDGDNERLSGEYKASVNAEFEKALHDAWAVKQARRAGAKPDIDDIEEVLDANQAQDRARETIVAAAPDESKAYEKALATYNHALFALEGARARLASAAPDEWEAHKATLAEAEMASAAHFRMLGRSGWHPPSFYVVIVVFIVTVIVVLGAWWLDRQRYRHRWGG